MLVGSPSTFTHNTNIYNIKTTEYETGNIINLFTLNARSKLIVFILNLVI